METAQLRAMVCTLRATRSLTIRQHFGRAIQQLCLSLIYQANPFLAAQIHDHPHASKPYAVSGLFRPEGTKPLWGQVMPGERAWLRIVGLQQGVIHALDVFTENSPDTIDLDRDLWELESVTWNAGAYPWAGRTSYPTLIREYQSTPPLRELRLEFITPTGFHSNGNNVPLPIPFTIFTSLSRRWEDFCDFPLPEELRAFVDYLVVLSRHRTETRILSFKRGSKQVGFVGNATFAIRKSNAHLKKADPELAETLSARHDDLSRALGLLAAFAFYSGVGIKTTAGMGMVRAKNGFDRIITEQ